MKIEQFIIYSFIQSFSHSVAFEPISFSNVFFSIDNLQCCTQPMMSILIFFLFDFKSISFFLQFHSQTLLWWLIFVFFSVIFSPFHSHLLCLTFRGTINSIYFCLSFFILYCCCRRRCLDYVTLSNIFARTVNVKMSMKLNDRVEEFILNFSLHLGIWARCSFSFKRLFFAFLQCDKGNWEIFFLNSCRVPVRQRNNNENSKGIKRQGPDQIRFCNSWSENMLTIN